MQHCLLRIPRVKTALTLISQLFLYTAFVFGEAPASSDVAWPTKPEPTVQSTIEANDQSFVQAVLEQEISKLDELLSEEFVYVHENGLISTKKQFIENFVPKGYVAAVLKEKEPMRQYNSTVFTISSGHLQLKSDSPHPQETVTHIWAEQKGKWRLVHRHETHRFEPIGKQLSQRGGPNPTMNLRAKPSPELYKTINEREATWVYGMLARNEEKMHELLDDSIRYVHVTGSVTDKKKFMEELRGGYSETYFLDATMRQFGDTVLVLHRAQYKHDGGPEQSPGECMHAWAKRGDRWVHVGRQSTRFEAY